MVKSKTKRDKRKVIVEITNEGKASKTIIATGRALWALEQLSKGPCTPITRPAPRWSDYVFRLRNEGVEIETEHEAHSGPYPGTHAKYHLRSKIRFMGEAA